MIIELRGVEFTNKGAELMLHAIMGFIRDRLPEAVFVMDRGARVPLDKLKQHNIQVKLNGRRFSRFGKFVPRLVRRKFRYILDQEIDIVMDGSGFAFGDQWGSAYAERRLGANIAKWKQQGKKIILLPQALSSILVPSMKKVMRRTRLPTDLIVEREVQSYHYLNGNAPDSRCMLAPDSTNLVKRQAPTASSIFF